MVMVMVFRARAAFAATRAGSRAIGAAAAESRRSALSD